MAKKKDVEWTVDEALEKLDRCVSRAWFTTLQALEGQTAWNVLNGSSQLTDAVNSTPCAPAASLIQDALLQYEIVTVIRLFDTHQSERLSFLTALEALSVPGVVEQLEHRTRNRPTKAGRNLEAFHKSIDSFKDRLAALLHPEFPRLKRLRNYRNSNIAHDLHFVEKRPPAYYEDIEYLLLEAIELVNDLGLAVRSTAYDWEMRRFEGSVRTLWEAASLARNPPNDTTSLFS